MTLTIGPLAHRPVEDEKQPPAPFAPQIGQAPQDFDDLVEAFKGMGFKNNARALGHERVGKNLVLTTKGKPTLIVSKGNKFCINLSEEVVVIPGNVILNGDEAKIPFSALSRPLKDDVTAVLAEVAPHFPRGAAQPAKR